MLVMYPLTLSFQATERLTDLLGGSELAQVQQPHMAKY